MHASMLHLTQDAAVAVQHCARSARHPVATIALAVALLAAFGGAADAATLKCKAKVQVFNDKPTAIKVLRFAYRTPDGQCKGNEGCNEGLSNQKLAGGAQFIWPEQTLDRVAEGNPIDAVAVEYQDDTTGQKSPSDPWGKAHWTDWHLKPGNDCKDGHTYKIHVGG
jgi:hypothetical protein